MLAFAIPAQVVFNGALTGLTYGLAAVALILVYRTSRVINLATAELGGFAAGVLAYFLVNQHVSYWVALPLCVGIGAAAGALVELVVVRRLSNASRLLVLVATIGVAQILLFGQAVLPKPTAVVPYPTPFTSRWEIGGVFVRGEHLAILVVMPALCLALAWFLARTRTGLQIRAAAANPDAGRLAGIHVRRTSTAVWALAGAFTALATILAAPFTTSTSSQVITLGSGLLVRVLAAALIGRMSSLPGALAGGVLIGVIDSVVFYNAPTNRGLTDLILFLVVVVVLLALSRRPDGDGSADWSFAPRSRRRVRLGGEHGLVRWLPVIGAVLAIGVALLPMVFANTANQQFEWSQVAVYAFAALSLTVLTGWTGQLSIGQFAFVGLGAMTATSMIHSDIGPGPALVAAAAVGALAAVIVGVPALRLPGLFLAVSTLALGVMASSWLLSRDVFLHGEPNAELPRLVIGSVDLTSQRTYYVVCLAFLVVAVWMTSLLRRSAVGRSFIAVRSNEPSAASFGITPGRAKLTAFAISGALAGVSGALLAGLLVTFTPDRFSGSESLRLVSIGVIGGLASVGGTVLGALWVVGIPALLPDSSSLPLLTSGVGLLVLVLFVPGGLAHLLVRVRDAIVGRFRPASTASAADADAGAGRDATGSVGRIRLTQAPRADTDASGQALTVTSIRVRRGPRLIVNDVSLTVGAGEVVGLIGANGAGKSTLMDAIGGFLPYDGVVELDGRDIANLTPARRAHLGLGRTYQGARLFGDLTVRETAQVAFDQTHRVDPVSVMVGLPHTWRAERRSRAEADELLDAFDLGEVADQFVDELSTGTRRILELACVVARSPRLICLDEPTAGIAQREIEALGPFLLRLRDELDASILVIEHDMPFLTGVSDRMYCLDLGRLIAEGTPAAVASDPAVVAAYLGTDAVAINRSGRGMPTTVEGPRSP